MSINKRPSQKISKSRNGFDMSQRQLFTSAVGQCLPVYYDLLQPGDSVNIDSALLTRTQTLSSNPMTRINEHIDYFFVPYRRIFTNFPQFYTSMIKDVSSSKMQFVTAMGQNLPSINLASIISQVPRPNVSSWNSGDPFPISNSDVDEMGVLKIHNAKRLLDLLGFGINTFGNLDGNPGTFAVNPALLCAYHAIYKDFYRLEDRDLPDYNLSSMDDYYNTPPSSDILSIYYRPWKRDFYTNVEVSPLFGGYSSPATPVPEPMPLLGLSTTALANRSGYTNYGTDVAETTSTFSVTSSTGTLDNLRRAGAIEKLAQLQRMNRKFWNYQMSALFGLEVPDNYDHVMYLGSHHYNLQFSDVVGTATTQDSVLGEVVGKGVGLPTEQKPIKFETRQHGFVMAIYSAIPEADYVAQGLDRVHTYLSKNHFYQSIYDNLGMQPKYSYEYNMTGNATQNSVITGWTYRWQELKSKPDLIHGAFSTSLRHWVTSRSSNSLGMNWWHYCINPNFIDSIGLVQFIPSLSTQLDGSGTTAEQEQRVRDAFNAYFNDAFGRDPLLHQLYFKALKVSEMSEFALPSHNSNLL